jgi:hypothetical protein
MMSNNSDIADPTSDGPSNPLPTDVPELVDDEENTESESDQVVPTEIHGMLTNAFRLAGLRRTFVDFELVRQELPAAKIKPWRSVFTSDVKAKLYSEFGSSLTNAVSREQWMATYDMTSFVQLVKPLKPPHAGEIGEHVTCALVNDLYSEVEDEAEVRVIGHEHTSFDLKLDIELVEMRDDPFDGRAECKLTRVSEFTGGIPPSSPNAVRTDISHSIYQHRPNRRMITRTHYNCLGLSCLDVDYGLLQNTASSILLHLVVNDNDDFSVDLRLRSKMAGTQVVARRNGGPFVTVPSQKKTVCISTKVSRSRGMVAFNLLLNESSAKIISLID